MLFIMTSELVTDETYHQVDLAFRKLAAKRRHAVTALGNVPVYLRVRLVFEITVAKIRDLLTVIKRSSFTLRPMTDRAILTK